MNDYTGRVEQVLLEAYQNASALLRLPPPALPGPGQYLQAHCPGDPEEVLPRSLYAAGAAVKATKGEDWLLPVSGAWPPHWTPGTQLMVRGPLGRGFRLPPEALRLALCALAGPSGPLLPLIHEALGDGLQVALFSDEELADLPLAVEVQPLEALPEGQAWADFFALATTIDEMESLPERLKLDAGRSPVGQALVYAPMPCGGLAQCGVCSLETARGPRLACEDGPVFELKDLLS